MYDFKAERPYLTYLEEGIFPGWKLSYFLSDGSPNTYHNMKSSYRFCISIMYPSLPRGRGGWYILPNDAPRS